MQPSNPDLLSGSTARRYRELNEARRHSPGDMIAPARPRAHLDVPDTDIVISVVVDDRGSRSCRSQLPGTPRDADLVTEPDTRGEVAHDGARIGDESTHAAHQRGHQRDHRMQRNPFGSPVNMATRPITAISVRLSSAPG